MLPIQPASAATKFALKITKVLVPSKVHQATPTFYLTVTLTGKPTFPVTVAYYPKACPKGCLLDGHSFLPLFATFTKKSDVLSVKKITACNLVDETPIFFDYAVSAKDARGAIAAPVTKGFTCIP